MNITILGAGAIGSLWAYHLASAGHNTSVWLREAEQSEFTLSLDNPSSDLDDTASHSQHRTKQTLLANNLSQLQHADILLITVKAWQVHRALSPLLEHIAPETILLFIHNGMGAVDELPKSIQKYPIVLATTTQAAYKSTKNSVHHTGLGTTVLGGYNALGMQCDFLVDVLNDALPEVSWSPSIHQALWNKLAINCAINPLTAIHQCLNGALLQPEHTKQIEQIISEVYAVMSAEKVDCSKQKLLETVYKVASATAKNHSSMQQDIAHKRTTEIDYITGHLCHVAQRHGIAVPANSALYDNIKRIEQSWSQL